MNPRRRLVFCSALAGSFGATACTALVQEPPTMKATAPVTPDSVIAFLHHFEALAMKEDFALLKGLGAKAVSRVHTLFLLNELWG